MQVKKALLVTGAVASMSLAGLTGLGVASAASSDSTNLGPSGIIDKIAAKFNLNRDEVAAVFAEDRAAHEANHQQKVDERLTQAVTDGKLTEEQKSKILAKLDELKASRESNREAFKSMAKDERHAAMEKERTDLQKWAADNNIPTDYLAFGFGGHGRGGPGMDMDRGERPLEDAAQ